MIRVITASGLNNAIILAVFGVIVMILGIYTLYTVSRMKKTEEPPNWLFSDSDIARIKQPAVFCRAIRPRTIALGLVCVFFGVYALIEYIFINMYLTKVIGVVAFLVFVIWFFVSLRSVKEKYMD